MFAEVFLHPDTKVRSAHVILQQEAAAHRCGSRIANEKLSKRIDKWLRAEFANGLV